MQRLVFLTGLVAAVLVLDVTDVKAGVLTTHYLGINGNSGNMFDVQVAGNALTVTSLDLNINMSSGSPANARLYTKSGTWVGFEFNEAVWTFVEDVTVTTANPSSP